jgi:hypothetical protein
MTEIQDKAEDLIMGRKETTSQETGETEVTAKESERSYPE